MKVWGWSVAAVLLVLGGLLGAGQLLSLHHSEAPKPDILVTQGDIDDIIASVAGGVDVTKLVGYDTLEEAAVHAAQRLYDCSRYYECAMLLVQRDSDHKFIVGPARSDYSGDSVGVSSSHPMGLTIVGNAHSHPCNPDSHFPTYFSPEDIIGDISHKNIGIMVDFCTGDVHEFDPTKDDPVADELPDTGGVYATHGRIVGHISIDTTPVEPKIGL